MRQNWQSVKAPDIEDIASLAQAAYETLPDIFRERCGNLVIQVVDFPDPATLRDFRDAGPFDLMGLYENHADTPDMVFLYRRPILDHWAEHEESLDHIVRHVLIHELGHHLGFSDDEMEEIEAKPQKL